MIQGPYLRLGLRFFLEWLARLLILKLISERRRSKYLAVRNFTDSGPGNLHHLPLTFTTAKGVNMIQELRDLELSISGNLRMTHCNTHRMSDAQQPFHKIFALHGLSSQSYE